MNPELYRNTETTSPSPGALCHLRKEKSCFWSQRAGSDCSLSFSNLWKLFSLSELQSSISSLYPGMLPGICQNLLLNTISPRACQRALFEYLCYKDELASSPSSRLPWASSLWYSATYPRCRICLRCSPPPSSSVGVALRAKRFSNTSGESCNSTQFSHRLPGNSTRPHRRRARSYKSAPRHSNTDRKSRLVPVLPTDWLRIRGRKNPLPAFN